MQFKTSLIIRNFDGAALKEQFVVHPNADDTTTVKADIRDVTTGIGLAQCLLQASDEKIPATQLSDRYLLALQMRSQAVVELTAEQLIICKHVAPRHPDTLVAAQLCTYLEGRHPEWNKETPKKGK